MKYLDIAIDLETLSTANDAMVLSIGAVIFDIETSEILEDFYTNIDHSKEPVGHIDFNTVQWWMGQSESARTVFTGGLAPIEAIRAFDNWIIFNNPDCLDVRVWGNGAVFDNTILTSTYKALNVQRPWSFRHDMDLRTIKAMAYQTTGIKPEVQRVGTHHNALDDAIFQANMVCESFNLLSGRKP